MQRYAQKRSLINKIKEYTDLGGIAAENAPFLNNPGFKELMDQLRETDDLVRSIMTGQSIGSANAPDDSASLKELVKGAKSNFNRREYMTAISYLGRFHAKMAEVANIFSNYNSNVSGLHEKFLLQDLDEDVVKHLRGLKDRFGPKKASLNKEAGIMDFFVNIGTERGRALSLWEKRYPEKIKALKSSIQKLINKSEDIFSKMISSFKKLADFRAERKIDDYIKEAGIVVEYYKNYDSSFKEYYEDQIKGFIEKLPIKENLQNSTVEKNQNFSPKTQPSNENQEKPETQPMNFEPKFEENKESRNTEFPPNTILTHENSKINKTQPITSPNDTLPISSTEDEEYKSDKIYKDIMSQVGKSLNQETPVTPFSPTIQPNPNSGITSAPPLSKNEIKVSHQEFYNILKSMKNEDTKIITSFVNKYAEKILKTDPVIAFKLFDSVNWK